jgi:uncharacterized damage-inducible protein DinB
VTFPEYMRRQFSYDAWANHEVLAAIRAADVDERSLQLMSHIVAAERLWLERLQQQPQSTPVWPKLSLEQCEAQAAEMERRWSEYLGSIDGNFWPTISYKNSKGETWTSTVLDILTHVTMHSVYHRGQIATHMRANGKDPAYTDFIHGVRQGQVK